MGMVARGISIEMGKEMGSDPASVAVEHFEQGFNCAQAVFLAFASQHCMDEVTALKLASPFGGGVSRRGEICGAVSGALLALGLVRGSATHQGKEATYLVGQEFLLKFESMHNALRCSDLLGYDISLPEAREKARQAGVFKTKCPLLVRDAVMIVRAMIDEGME
jgi:C_GCAxxG_C_C family probable redox protein